MDDNRNPSVEVIEVDDTVVNQSGFTNLYEPNAFNAVFAQNELQYHADVSDKNLRAINARTQSVLHSLKGMSDMSVAENYMSECNLGKLHEEKKVLIDKMAAQQNTLMDINKEIVECNKRIAELQLQLKKTEGETDNIKNDKKDIKSKMVAETAYRTFLNFEVTVNSTSEDNSSYNGTAVFANKKYPVHFTIDRETNNIISFDASSFLGPEEQAKIAKNFEESGSTPGLICELRKLALKAK